MLLLQSLDIGSQLQSLLIVAIPDTGVHELGDLHNLQDLCVSIQGQAVHPPTGSDLLCLLYKTSGRKRQRGVIQHPETTYYTALQYTEGFLLELWGTHKELKQNSNLTTCFVKL